MGHVCLGRYDTPRQSRTGRMRGDYATVEELWPGVWKVCLVASLPIQPVPPASFLDVLRGWGHTWLWNKMKVLGGTDWLLQAIAGGTLILAHTSVNITRSNAPLPSYLSARKVVGASLERFPRRR